MTQRRIAHRVGTQSLVWLLLVAVALLGLTVTRQQALGSLHLHKDRQARGTNTLAATVSSVASSWLSRWQQQQVLGHGRLVLGTDDAAIGWPTDEARMSRSTGMGGDHAHDSLERHHHASDDETVAALDGTAETAESSTTGALVLLSVGSAPVTALVLPMLDGRPGPWPTDRAGAFVSRSVAPPLRPPAV